MAVSTDRLREIFAAKAQDFYGLHCPASADFTEAYRIVDEFETLHAIAVRVSEADNQRLGAEGEPGFEAMREMEDALAALHQFVSNPASDLNASADRRSREAMTPDKETEQSVSQWH